MCTRLLPLLTIFALAVSGCCALEETCSPNQLAVEDDTDSLGAPPETSDRGEASTLGCDEDAISQNGATRCATCDFGTICGVPDEALCETRQNNIGAACQLCVSDANVILYDDCNTNAGATAIGRCEPTPGRNNGEQCTTCFDVQGAAVSTTCAPAGDTCETFTQNDGRVCTTCLDRRGNSFSTCDAPNIDPVRCVAYGEDGGRCVDCFDARGGLLSHACTPNNGAVRCQEQVQPEGLVCTVCTDGAGVAVERRCEDSFRGGNRESCERLDFSEQRCVVCTDDDSVTFVACEPTTCEENGAQNDGESVNVGGACRSDSDCQEGACFNGQCQSNSFGGVVGGGDEPAQAPNAPVCQAPLCQTHRGDDGSICRTCPTSDNRQETRCMGDAVLSCEVVQESQGRVCVQCSDSATDSVVYRDCDGVPPPVCRQVATDNNEICTVCNDAVSGDVVYTTCDDRR